MLHWWTCMLAVGTPPPLQGPPPRQWGEATARGEDGGEIITATPLRLSWGIARLSLITCSCSSSCSMVWSSRFFQWFLYCFCWFSGLRSSSTSHLDFDRKPLKTDQERSRTTRSIGKPLRSMSGTGRLLPCSRPTSGGVTTSKVWYSARGTRLCYPPPSLSAREVLARTSGRSRGICTTTTENAHLANVHRFRSFF